MGSMNAEIDQTKISVVTQVALGESFLVEEDLDDIPVDQAVTMHATMMNGNVSVAIALEASDNVTEKPIVSMAQTRCSAQEDRFQDPTLEKSTMVVEAVVDMAASLADLRSSHVKSVDNVCQRKGCVISSQTVLSRKKRLSNHSDQGNMPHEQV